MAKEFAHATRLSLLNPADRAWDRFAQEPEKQETYHRLTAAINQAKESGNLATLRMIADDPHGFILRQGWAALDFREEDQIAQLRRLWESIELEIIRVLEAVNALRESPDFELLTLTERTPEFFDETVGLHIESLEEELARLNAEADGLAGELEELTGAVAVSSYRKGFSQGAADGFRTANEIPAGTS